MIDINIKGTLYGIAAAQPVFHNQNNGQFINMGSVASLFSHAGGVVYSATKWAVKAISEGLREEAQAGYNVRVTSIYPGVVNTELTHSITDDKTRKEVEKIYEQIGISPERIATVVGDVISMSEDTTLNEIVIRPTKQVM